MKITNIPGTAWVALITLISGWLSQYFGDWAWTATAIVVLSMVANLIKLNTGETPDTGEQTRSLTPTTKPSALSTFLWG